MEDDVDATAIAMAREWPVRSAITIVLPMLFVISQLANCYYHGISLVYPGIVAVVFLGISVLMIQQQVAAFRISQLESRHTDDDR